jgi:hypothetical protein
VVNTIAKERALTSFFELASVPGGLFLWGRSPDLRATWEAVSGYKGRQW